MKTITAFLIAVFLLAACGNSDNTTTTEQATAAPMQESGEPAAPRLPQIDINNVTVSGISSGAYMATQMHIAFSDMVSGAGLIAGGPYACAQNSMRQALGPCISGDAIDVEALLEETERRAMQRTIAAAENLSDDKAWLFHGSNDTAVGAAVIDAAADYYTSLLDTAPVVVTNIPAAHGIATIDSGAACDTFAEPYLQACDYDSAGMMLEHLLGPLEPRATTTSGRIATIDQRGFAGSELLDDGLAYIPAACDEQTCGLHIVFHGCKQSTAFIGDAMVTGAGFNEWADKNALVIFYPQAAASRMAPMNPLGCWDWWGFTGDDYDTRAGKQVNAIKTLVDRMAVAP